MKPSVIEEIDNILEKKPVCEGNMVSPNDQLFLEDESGRMQLNTEQPTSVLFTDKFVTGVPIVVHGHFGHFKGFNVTEFRYVSREKSNYIQLLSDQMTDENLTIEDTKGEIIALVSGLNFAAGDGEKEERLRNSLLNLFGNTEGMSDRLGQLIKRVNKLVVAGGLVSEVTGTAELERGSYLDKEKEVE